jgi:diphosphomevalonate decarboxylase
MNKKYIVDKILQNSLLEPKKEKGKAFAPSNIALCKYWGKRDLELNLPVTGSLSISLGHYGATTAISLSNTEEDVIILNGLEKSKESPFYKRLRVFLDLFRPPGKSFCVETMVNIPVGAGLASSAAGFASVILALNDLFHWNLPSAALSILARLGSGSACRSIFPGFVEWQVGVSEDGMDSFGIPLDITWPALRLGLLIVEEKEKPVSSSEAMKRSVLTSPYYPLWPKTQAADLALIKEALTTLDFIKLGKAAEANAMSMHALINTSRPAIVYSVPETIQAMHLIWQERALGLLLYFTQDAGPNLKLLFLEKDTKAVLKIFPNVTVVSPFLESQ